ncbi:MAG: shikimate dehydrogenase [Candidatus Latescibacterota bacterium]
MRLIGGSTGIYGVIGDPIEHTLSPLMQNRALEAMGVDGAYVPFRVIPEELENAIRAVSALHIRGLNVTVPHKTAVMRLLDGLSDTAKAIGAVNTIINHRGVLTGDNTDAYGFEQFVISGGVERFPPSVCILGAGGAARGVAYACLQREEVEEIVILNRTVSRAQEIAREFKAITPKRISAAPADVENQRKLLPSAGMIVNTTTVGMIPRPEDSPAPDPGVFHPGQVVCDIIYTPLRTRFLREAAARGAKTVGGFAMLAFQGARSLTLWTGREAPVEIMLEALRERFGSE